jgi:hypothetical protein
MSKSSHVTRRTAIRARLRVRRRWPPVPRVRPIKAPPTWNACREVEVDSEVYPNGRFARLSDPEGNPIQLWQPGGKDRG